MDYLFLKSYLIGKNGSMKCKRSLHFLFVLIFLFSCTSTANKSVTDLQTDWCICIYMAGDSDICDYVNLSLDRMRCGCFGNSNVRVLVMADGINKEDKKVFKRLRKGESVELSEKLKSAYYLEITKNGYEKLQDLGNYDSGNVQSCDDFLNFCYNRVKAKHYMLNFWGHGSSTQLLKDEVSGSSISIDDFVMAIKRFKNRIGHNIEILGLDACAMMNLSVIEKLKNTSDYLIASQDNQNSLSWDYKAILNFLTANNVTSTESLVKVIFESYVSFYESGINEYLDKIKDLDKERKNDAISVVNLKLYNEMLKAEKVNINKFISSAISSLNIKNFDYFDDIRLITTKEHDLKIFLKYLETLISDRKNLKPKFIADQAKLLANIKKMQNIFNTVLVYTYSRENTKLPNGDKLINGISTILRSFSKPDVLIDFTHGFED